MRRNGLKLAARSGLGALWLSAAALLGPANAPAESGLLENDLNGILLDGMRLATGDLIVGQTPRFEPRRLLPPTAAERLDVAILFLPEHTEALAAPPQEGHERLVITGAYSSGDRFAPEGFVIRAGEPTHPYPQGWDGLLLVEADGRASLHNVASVTLDGRARNLRDAEERAAFVERAQALRVSAIQSHLLISDGALDIQPRSGARRFRRRLLYQTADGRIGVFDTGSVAVTLYDAAVALMATEKPQMALNLDMGDYDYCERAGAAGRQRCGWLALGGDERLTNLISITWRAE